MIIDSGLTLAGVLSVGLGGMAVAGANKAPGGPDLSLERRGIALGILGLVLLCLAASTEVL